MRHLTRVVAVTATVALSILVAGPARAADHFLTVGGGSSAANNQVSLEKNVLYLQRFLAERGLADAPHEILFADGAGGARDLVYSDPNARRPRVNELLGDVLGADNGLYDDYRAHDIPHLWGPSNRASLDKWFATIGAKLADGDRLLVYFTGHGGKGSTLSMWNENDMPAKEFAALLDRLPPKVSVVIVMVQCFSGGFADMIYAGGDPGKGLAKQDRCGFFATVSDRLAAGCTSDVDEDNYREYSTYFWAALYGQTRTGQPVPPPDFDNDGKTSLAEAHGYVLIHSDTIDISVKTSDALLRKYSKMKPASPATKPAKPASTASETSAAPAAAPLVDAEGSLDDLTKLAPPAERAVLAGLAAQLDLKPDAPVKAARALASDLQKKQRDLDRDAGPARKRRNDARRAIRSTLMTRWPELSNLLHPKASAALLTDADAIVKLIESAPQYAEFEKADAEIGKTEAEKMALDRKWVKTQRFIRQAEHVALAANLTAVAPPDVVAKYKAITAAEAGLLGNAAAGSGRAAGTGGGDGVAQLGLPGLDQKRVDGVGCDPLPAER